MKKTDKYIIIPPCSDYNRGDQALVWETMRFAKDADFIGDFYFMAEKKEPVNQSKDIGLKPITPILEHPSRKFSKADNINMNWKLKLKWGSLSIIDFIWSFFMLTFCRNIISYFMSEEKKETYKLFKEAKAIFVKGGGFIHSYGGITAPYYIYFQLFHIYLALSLKKDVYICPNSFGPFHGIGVKWMVKRVFKKTKFVYARESRSNKMCKTELGIDIPVSPDFGFYLTNKGTITKEEFLKKHKIPNNRKLVAITARPHRFPHSENPELSYTEFKNNIKDFSIWLYKNNYFPVFIEHVYAVNNHEDDDVCLTDIIKELAPNTFVYFQDRKLNCSELKNIYGFFDYIVGTRFHSMIFSMANHVPGIAITYVGNKGEGIMENMGLEDFYIPIDKVSIQVLIKKFNYLIENEKKVLDKINTYLNNSRRKREELINFIKNEKD